MKPLVQFHFEKKKYKLIVSNCVNKYLLSRYIKNNCGYSQIAIHYNFVSSSSQIKINKEFKEHNYNTDILTFNLSNSDCELTGDVYISLKQIKKNAIKFQSSIENELNRVLIHGYYHLLGFEDETKDEIKLMRKLENRYLKYTTKKKMFHVERR